MRVKVGLVTGAWHCSPAVSPLTKCVLPAPSSPHSPSTSPRRSVAAIERPSAIVSSALCEMVVATCGSFFGSACRLLKLADAGQGQARELSLPGLFETSAFARAHGKKQFVVLAISLRLFRGATRR